MIRLFVRGLLPIMLCLPVAVPAQKEDLHAEVVMGCIYSVGEFGSELVEICRKENLAAAQALRAYPKADEGLIERCSRRLMASGGWAAVKVCVDQDLEAQRALNDYPAKHHALIAECQAENAELGPRKTKFCVDQRLSGAGPDQ